MDDIDDLFGDGAGLSLPSRPPVKELYQRLDELRGSGCCQFVAHQVYSEIYLTFHRAVAWSKWGSIASIAQGGTSLELRNLRCHPENGTWALSEPSSTPALTMASDGTVQPLKHLCWSPTGSDLAVIDAVGRVSILDVFSSLNKPSLRRDCRLDPADDSYAVVGCYWLNIAAYPANRPVRAPFWF